MQREAAVIMMLAQAWQINCLTLAVFSLTARLGEAGLDLIVSCLHGKVNCLAFLCSGDAPGAMSEIAEWRRRRAVHAFAEHTKYPLNGGTCRSFNDAENRTEQNLTPLLGLLIFINFLSTSCLSLWLYAAEVLWFLVHFNMTSGFCCV